jgi:4-hydroxy-tetrahydrodipicolinate synthase
MLNESARGVYIISVTPFDERGALDLDGTDRLIDFYVQAGADGLTILGMMGEAPKLAHQEAVEFARRVIARAGKLPVVVGVSAPGLASLAALTNAVRDLGAAGVMIAPPGGLKGDDAIVTYFENCAEAIGPVPFALQDFPQANGLFIPVSVIERIAATCPTFVMLNEKWLDFRASHGYWFSACVSAGSPRITALFDVERCRFEIEACLPGVSGYTDIGLTH